MGDSFRIRPVCLHCREKPDVSLESKQANDNSVKLQNGPQKKRNFLKINSGARVCVGLCFDPEHLQPSFDFPLCMQDMDCFRGHISTHRPWLMYYSWTHTLWQWWVVNFLGLTLKRLCRPGRVHRFKAEIFIIRESCPHSPEPKKRLLFENRQRVEKHYYIFHGHFLGPSSKIAGT